MNVDKKVAIVVVAFICGGFPIASAHWTELRNEFEETIPDSIENELNGNLHIPKLDAMNSASVYRTDLEAIEPAPPQFSGIPQNELEYNFRVYATNCSYPQPKQQKNVVNKSGKRSEHLPFGVPYSPEDNSTLRMLYNEDYILAFDLKYRIPMWTAFTLDGKRSASEVGNPVWTGDARIPFRDTSNCGDYDESIVRKQYILQRPLYPPNFSSPIFRDQAAYVTNSIPKSTNHSNVLETKVNQILVRWAEEEGPLNVMMGPAFDLLGTGIRPDIGRIMRTHESYGPLVVPTHIFVVTTLCSNKVAKINDCDHSELLTRGFLLPNEPFPQTFESARALVLQSTSNIAGIEKLTGLSFFTGLPVEVATRLRTMVSHIPI